MKIKTSVVLLGLLVVLFAAVPAQAASISVTKVPGVLNVEQAGFRAEVPRDSCIHDYRIEADQTDYAKIVPLNEFYVTRSVDLKITTGSAGTVNLNKPVRLTYTFNDIDFKRASNMNTGLSVGHFSICRWDEAGQTWSQLPSTVFWNGSSGCVEAETSSSGRYALVWSYDSSASMSKIAGDAIRIMVDLSVIDSDVSPYLKDGRTMVPLRVIAENLGVNVDWIAAEQRIDLYKRNTGDKVQLWINRTGALKNNTSLSLDAPPEITDGRTFIPLRFVAEAFGAKVDWDSLTHTAKVTGS